MQDLQKDNQLVIKIDTEELSSTQVRLVKSINSLLTHVITAEDETEFFNSSADLLKKAAEVIKHAQFANQNTHMRYGDQAVEFAVDFLNEALNENKVGNIDN